MYHSFICHFCFTFFPLLFPMFLVVSLRILSHIPKALFYAGYYKYE